MWKIFPEDHILSTAGDALRGEALTHKPVKARYRWPTKHSRQQQDHSITLMPRMVNSSFFFVLFFSKFMFNKHILVTIENVWSWPEDYGIECNSQNDIICHPRP